MKISTATIATFDDGKQITLAPHIKEVIYALYAANSRIAAIRLARAHYQIDLKDAKDLCDHIGALT